MVLDDGTPVTAHCPNPGAMLGVNTPGLAVWLSKSDDPKRKLAHTLELVETAEGALTGRQHHASPTASWPRPWRAGLIPELTGYETIRREVNYGEASRVDFLLTSPDRPSCWLEIKNVQSQLQRDLKPDHRVWLEVKNCHLSRTKGLAEFPTALPRVPPSTSRSLKRWWPREIEPSCCSSSNEWIARRFRPAMSLTRLSHAGSNMRLTLAWKC